MIFKKLLNNKVKEIAEQRKVLTETFPYTDWKKVPYTQYDKFLSLKDLIGECGVVWTNAFRRSNTESEDTRKYLKDYSKHYEYVQDFNNWNVDVPSEVIIKKTSNSVTITNNLSTEGSWTMGCYSGRYVNQEWKCYIDSEVPVTITAVTYNPVATIKNLVFKKGINTIPAFTESEISNAHAVYIAFPVGHTVTITQIPNEVDNERDIELFNFGYSRQSGFNGYVQDFRDWDSTDESATIVKTEERLKISGNTGGWVVALWNVSTGNRYGKKEWVVNLHIEKSSSDFVSLLFYSQSENQIYKTISLHEGKNIIPALTEEEYSDTIYIRLNVNVDSIVTLTQVPEYPGALVGDGVDDYGQCVKDFALPDDYTVVAMRELLNAGPSGIINKTRATGEGAFIFEYGGSQSYSYGDNHSGLTTPKLFSYQTKASYNGTVLTPGTGADTTDDKLLIFRLRDGTSNYKSAALYSFGIFNRTLTAEELALVEDCMYLELEYNTNILDNIEYYDILDARYRSNEEAEDKRNKWNGRLDKLHLTLNNYAYSGNSGWNGWPTNWESWNNWVIPQQGGLVEVSKSIIKVKNFGALPTWSITSNSEIASIPEMRIKISGLKTGASLFFITQVSDTRTNLMTATGDGIYTVPADTSAPDYYAIYCNGYSANEDADLTIELLPDYGGALVSDGVDDYAVSDETIDEEIGGIVVMAEKISNPTTDYGYVFSSRQGLGTSEENQIAALIVKAHDNFILGDPWTLIDKNIYNIYTLSRSPKSPNNKLMISNSNSNEIANDALYQLRLIKSQPSDIQLEVIKQQVLREHNDYIKEMGWV